MDHPEIAPVCESLNTFVQESDRGAVLVAASIVDEYLCKLFNGIAPEGMSNAHRMRVLEYPGPLGSFAAKADVAFATRLIGLELHRSIGILRRLRNDVAHSPNEFRLGDYLDQVRAMYDLGAGVPAFINEMGARMIIDSMVGHLIESDEGRPADERLFESPQHILNELLKRPEVMSALQEKAYRAELGVATALVCALIMHRRDAVTAVVGRTGLIS